jgi:dihydrofolate synthase/folylpolyglutamate synthase|tara:strand:- start:8159 stop:9454 length:1296 start_codon:yes stop_codon:yes gene_type:complete
MSRSIDLLEKSPNKQINIEKLLTLNQHKIRLGLTRIKKVIKRLKITHRLDIKYLTVNGTSAKNSIIQIFKSILIQHRQKYAATYSPHLISITERFEHNQKFIKLNKLKNILIKVAKYKNLTHFEKLVIAFGIFIKDLKLDWAIGEFGLFGRLDGMRALFNKPNYHIISPISWDHLNWTKTKKRNFKTLKEIVFEKTSFLKSAVYVSKQDPEVLKLIKYNLRNNRSDKFFYGSDFKIIKKNKRYFYKDNLYCFQIKSNLIGDYMYENMAPAIKLALDNNIPINTIKKGLLKVDIKGRLQIVRKGKLLRNLNSKDKLILDGAHNAQQSERLVKVMNEFKFKNKYAVISMINSKDPVSFLKPFKGKFKKLYFLDNPEQNNFIPKEKLKAVADKLKIKSEIRSSFEEVIQSSKSKTLWLATGSLYWMGYLLKKNY